MRPCIDIDMQVECDHNFSVVLEFLASFAHDIPPASDFQARSVHVYDISRTLLECVIAK